MGQDDPGTDGGAVAWRRSGRGDLIAAGTHVAKTGNGSKPVIAPEAVVQLADYRDAALVQASFATYLDTRWRPWADEEKHRRRTIRLYSQLFTLQQQLEGAIVEAQLELVWGVGLGCWNCGGTTVSYPLIAKLVEISLNPVTAAIEIRPREIETRVELDWYASVDNPGVAAVEKSAREFFAAASVTFSPFDRGTFEPLLRTAASNLRKQVEESRSFPPALLAMVTEPETTNPVIELPVFRGVSAPCETGSGSGNKDKARDVYFPKPFNDEQFRIIQLLDVLDGVIVQGPPGTGKTHTIANVICHYLAEGKRVLVTSMKDPALREVQEKLPNEIRPLAISLLTSEQEGMKQFEHAIQKIASEVQTLDRADTARRIRQLEDVIDQLHARLVGVDLEITQWAKRNLSKITINTEHVDPQEAAREITGQPEAFAWLPDPLGIEGKFEPQFGDSDITRLRDARRALGEDIDYLDASLPALGDFPDSKTLLAVHRDLSSFEKLKQNVEKGEVPELADAGEETMVRCQEALAHIVTWRELRDQVAGAKREWTATIRTRLRTGDDHLTRVLEDLGAEIERALDQRKTFLKKPVITPPGMELDTELVEAAGNLAESRSAFGIKGLFGRSSQKKELECVRVLGQPPAGAEGWKHVAEHLALSKCLRELGVRWNAVAAELQLDRVKDTEPQGGIAAGQAYALYGKVRAQVNAERKINRIIATLFPGWQCRASGEEAIFGEFEKVLHHHLEKNRLANVWAT